MSCLFAETAEIFALRGGNIDFLTANRVVLQSLIDKIEEIKGYTYEHCPFDVDLYWTSLTDSNATVSGTSVVEFSDEMKTLLIEARTDMEGLLVRARRHQYADSTNYSDVYKAATAIMDQALKQYSNYVTLVLTPYCDHDSNDLSALFTLDSNILSSSMTATDAVTAAIADGTLVDHARYYYSEEDSNTVYRKAHIGNMNMQSLRTFKRIIESLKGAWPRSSVVLASMNGKYAGSDMTGTSSPVQSVSTGFSDYLNYLGSISAVGAYVATQVDEYIEASRSSDDGDINFTTAYVKDSVLGFSKYFDGDTSTVDSNTPITGDLISKIKDISAYLITDSAFISELESGTISDYSFMSAVISS